jgi:hypothetical protein
VRTAKTRTKTYRAVVQDRYRRRKSAGKVLVTWAVEPETAQEFFHALRVAVPPNPTPADFATCLDVLVERVTE